MRSVLKETEVLLLVMCAVFFGYAQEPAPNTVIHAKDEKLPPLLRPSDYAVNRVRELGGEVFRLLPMEEASERGSSFGAYYCFKDRTYSSYQISFLRGELKVGGGWSYGFYADLGEREFQEIDRTSPEAAFFLSYKPPKLEPDIRSEIERLNDVKVDGVRLTRRVTVQTGHTYLLRSIDFGWADTAVVLHVLESSTDGAITIVWKKLAEFPLPLKLFMPDPDLQRKVDAVLAELNIQDLHVSVSDNTLMMTGVDKNYDRLIAELRKREFAYRGIGFFMKRAK